MGSQQATGDLRVAIAQPADLPAVLTILREAAIWLWERGVHQWPPEQITAANFAESVNQGAVALAWRGGQAVGSVTLTWADPAVWGPDDGQAGYIHKLAVRRVAAGQGVSHALLAWAEAQCAMAGKRYARLDCWAGSAVLRAFYTNAGYTLRDIALEYDPDEDEQWECARFEKTVGGATPPAP